MIDQPHSVQGPDARELLAAGTSLAVASTAADLLSDRIALGHAAPELLCFERATPEQLARLLRASDELACAVVEFLEALQPQLVPGTRERMALAVAKAEDCQTRAREAARGVPSRVAVSAGP